MLYSFVGREPGEEEVGRALITGELIKKAWDEDRGARHRTPWGHLLINTVWCPGRRTEHKHSASDLSKRQQAESISLGTLCWAFKFVGHTVLKLYPKPDPSMTPHMDPPDSVSLPASREDLSCFRHYAYLATGSSVCLFGILVRSHFLTNRSLLDYNNFTQLQQLYSKPWALPFSSTTLY